MKNISILKVIFLTILMIFSSQVVNAERLLPVPRPSIDLETKNIILQKKRLLPQKKPVTKKENQESNTIVNIEKTENLTKVEVFIYPLKKPIIVQKKTTKVLPKSSILSKRDFAIAKKAFQLIDKKKWKSALKVSKQSRDKTLYKLVNYLYLKKRTNSASLYDYISFINNNPSYPRINRLRYLAEHKINLKIHKKNTILNWFNIKEPLSEFGKIKLGEVYLLEGKIEQGAQLIKEGWVQARLSKNQLRYLRKKYKKIITVEDNVKRTDWHAWEGKHWDVQKNVKIFTKRLYNFI